MNEIKRYRKSYGLTQVELAKELDISYSTLTKIENGVRKPSFELMKKMSDFFDTPVDTLFFAEINH